MEAAETQDGRSLSTLHAAVLVDGGPENYRKWASVYEQQHAGIYIGHQYLYSKWLSYYPQTSRSGLTKSKHKILDAGCGTGLVANNYFDLVQEGVVEIYGADLSPDMLEIAKTKNVYEELKVANLKEQLPYQEESFDSLVCGGVFVQGHCGPECLPHLMRVLKNGGVLIASVRNEFFKETEEQWMKQIQECPCELKEQAEMPYYKDMTAVLLVIRKV